MTRRRSGPIPPSGFWIEHVLQFCKGIAPLLLFLAGAVANKVNCANRRKLHYGVNFGDWWILNGALLCLKYLRFKEEI